MNVNSNSEEKNLPCPNCACSLPVGTTNCQNCDANLFQEIVSCPDCGAENLAFADYRDISCVDQCGAQIPVASLLGYLPQQENFCEAIKLLNGFQKFSKQQTSSGETYYKLETNMASIQVWSVNTDSPAHFVTEAQRERIKLKNEVILLPTQVIESQDIDDTYLLLVYPSVQGENLDILEPAALALGLFELIEHIHENGFCVPTLTPADLDVTPSGKVRLCVGHKLCSQETEFTGNLNPAFIAPELNQESIARQVSDIFTVARIWYWIISGGILGHFQPNLDKIPSPRIWYPEMPVGLWGILLGCMQPQPELRPAAAEVLSLLKPQLKQRQHQEPEPVELIVGMHSDVGRKFDHNQEDACDCNPTKQIVVVSDGVSQSGWGEKASEIVVKTLTENHTSLLEFTPEQAGRFLPQQINKANIIIGQYILEEQNASREANQFCDPMSATVVAAYLSPDFVTVVSLGDSRAYLFSANYLERLTEDQNGRWESLMDGKSFAEAAAKEDAGSLACWVGDFAPSSENPKEIAPKSPKDVAANCQLIYFQWVPGDKLLLCSDGVHDFLTDSEIASILKQSDDPNAIAQKLVSEAITAQDIQGTGDNVTALVVVVKQARTARGVALGFNSTHLRC
ncbi:MAG TPA: hypothetical protein ENG03_02455 [Thioploca sp.]|nr:MAG: hypothetical protein DRR19_06370 [Gammaproteobacteria bacterium]HDN25959.1 hypothetical protein [Thioploca sp.]